MINETEKHKKLLFQINLDRCGFHLPMKYFIQNCPLEHLNSTNTGYNLTCFIRKVKLIII